MTLAFRADEPIWATSFLVRDNLAGQVLGKATDQRSVLAVLDRLKKDPRFRDAKLLDMRDASGRTRDISFSVGLVFAGEEARP